MTIFKIKDENIINGLRRVRKNTAYFGRWRMLAKNPVIIADGAHNIDAIDKTMTYISEFSFRKIHIIIGVVADKDWENVLKILPENSAYYFTKANIPRAMDENKLLQVASQFGLIGDAFPTLPEALNAAKSKAQRDDLILVLGSIYLVGELI